LKEDASARSVENSFWNNLWSCWRTDYTMNIQWSEASTDRLKHMRVQKVQFINSIQEYFAKFKVKSQTRWSWKGPPPIPINSLPFQMTLIWTAYLTYRPNYSRIYLLGCETLLLGKWLLTCWLNMSSSFWKVQDSFFKTLGATQHHIPKDCKSSIRPQGKSHALHSQSNLKSLGQITKSHILHIQTATSHKLLHLQVHKLAWLYSPNLIKIQWARFCLLAIWYRMIPPNM
jgi:hypothetical protein